jgi:hypothetical protein
MREHQPITIDQFNGLYDRGDVEEVPLDHFSESNNIKFIGNTGFGTRDGISPYQAIGVPLANILRIYNYATVDRNTLLVLTIGGNLYHVVDTTTVYGPILTIAAMTDFGFVSYNGRAYITPFTTEVVGDLNRERGLNGEFLYVYLGDGTLARKAGGTGASSAQFAPINPGVGNTDPGLHIIGVVWETDTGYLTPPGQLTVVTTLNNPGLNAISIGGIEVPVGTQYVKKSLVASKVITDFNGDLQGYDLFFIPGQDEIPPATTVVVDISFYDADLLDDASHLFDNFSTIAAGVALCIYHDRLCLCTQFDNISLIRVSAVGEPEAISQIDGFCIVPPNGDPITNITVLRDVLYAFKRNKTHSFVDNDDAPSSWPITTIDNAIGCGVHGLATVIDSGSSSVDYIIVASYTGVVQFNGRYILPELTWKIGANWQAQAFKTDNRRIQLCNDVLTQRLYIIKTDRSMYYADYSNGFDPKSIKWTPWTFDSHINAIALVNVNQLVFGFEQ